MRDGVKDASVSDEERAVASERYSIEHNKVWMVLFLKPPKDLNTAQGEIM